MYIYEGHMSESLYTSDEYLDYENLYCEQCGDSDSFIGQANTKEEATMLLMPMTDSDYCGWNKEYIEEFVNENFYEE